MAAADWPAEEPPGPTSAPLMPRWPPAWPSAPISFKRTRKLRLTFITSRRLAEAPPLASVGSKRRLARSSPPLRPWNESSPPTLRPFSKAAMFPLPMFPSRLSGLLDRLPSFSSDHQAKLELLFTLGELQSEVKAPAASKAHGLYKTTFGMVDLPLLD
ncbi:MAG: hypothetical protein ACK53Y_14525, partial [bacterium]